MPKILIVEDDAQLRIFYSELLSEYYSVECASDGEEGFSKAVSKKFDLILLDLMMPKLDGVGFLQKKIKTEAIADVPVVVMSNLGQEEILKKCFDLGVKYYVFKVNTTPDKILTILSEALNGVDKSKVKE